jgi:hypothetical protein
MPVRSFSQFMLSNVGKTQRKNKTNKYKSNENKFHH